MTNKERIKIIKQQVHETPPDDSVYSSTSTRDNTNCYSYALGATHPYLSLYRIGTISGRKSIEENYVSTAEIIDLLLSDLDCLNLEYTAITEIPEQLPERTYIIKLYVKIYANGMIGDYHFIRFDKGTWSEKWRGQKPATLEGKSVNRYDENWMYHHVLTLKITR